MDGVIDSLNRIFDMLNELDAHARAVSPRLVRLETLRSGDADSIARLSSSVAALDARIDKLERGALVRNTQAGTIGALVGAATPFVMKLIG